MDSLKIKVNNGKTAIVELLTGEDGRRGLRHTLVDAGGNTVRRDFVDEGDLISLLNWYTYQKENGNPGLTFKEDV